MKINATQITILTLSLLVVLCSVTHYVNPAKNLTISNPNDHATSSLYNMRVYTNPKDLPSAQFLEMQKVYNIEFTQPDFTKPIVVKGSFTIEGRMNILPKRVVKQLIALISYNSGVGTFQVAIKPDSEGYFSQKIELPQGPGTYNVELQAPNDSSDLDNVGYLDVVAFLLISK